MKKNDRSDRALGIRASRCVAAKTLDLDGPHARFARDYQPTPPEILDDLLLDLDIAFDAYTFVDLGAGKGRVLCLATQWPFSRVVGVELSRTLVTQARENLASYAAEIRHGDAAAFVFPPTPLVVFMYNPFDAPVVRAVLDNLERSLEVHPRDVRILYFEPVHDAVVRERWWIEPERAAPRWARYTASSGRANGRAASSA